jgi:hypothetical protein
MRVSMRNNINTILGVTMDIATADSITMKKKICKFRFMLEAKNNLIFNLLNTLTQNSMFFDEKF